MINKTLFSFQLCHDTKLIKSIEKMIAYARASTRASTWQTRPKRGRFGSFIKGGLTTFGLRYAQTSFSHPRIFSQQPAPSDEVTFVLGPYICRSPRTVRTDDFRTLALKLQRQRANKFAHTVAYRSSFLRHLLLPFSCTWYHSLYLLYQYLERTIKVDWVNHTEPFLPRCIINFDIRHQMTSTWSGTQDSIQDFKIFLLFVIF